MQFETERLTLQELSSADLGDIHQLHSLPEVDEFNTLGIPHSISTTELLLSEWIAQKDVFERVSYIFSIRSSETNKFIGLIALNKGKPNFKIAEIWYKTHPDYWGKGYTTEALSKILEFGFKKLYLHRIEAGCAVENVASIRVLEKVGMIREGRKRNILPIRGNWVDNYFYSILDTDSRIFK